MEIIFLREVVVVFLFPPIMEQVGHKELKECHIIYSLYVFQIITYLPELMVMEFGEDR